MPNHTKRRHHGLTNSHLLACPLQNWQPNYPHDPSIKFCPRRYSEHFFIRFLPFLFVQKI